MKVLNRKCIAHTKYLDLNESTYVDMEGKEKSWVWAQRPYDQQAVVVAATAGDDLILIKEYRVPIESYIYELPAGLVDPGEDPVKAGCREFEEETGYKIIELIRPLSPPVVSSPGLSDESVCYLFGKASTTPNKTAHGVSEDIEVMRYSRASVAHLLQDRSVKIGSRAYLVCLHFVTYGGI